MAKNTQELQFVGGYKVAYNGKGIAEGGDWMHFCSTET